jgi:hypothetical protein
MVRRIYKQYNSATRAIVGGKKEEAHEGFRGMDNSDSNLETE